MSICLTVTVKDPEVEALLEYLETQKCLYGRSKVRLLERAIKWIQASDPSYFSCDPRLGHSSRLECGVPDLSPEQN